MSIIKAINLTDESNEIWKKRFGKRSQGFSRWIQDKLLEEEAKDFDISFIQKTIKELMSKRDDIEQNIQIYKEKLTDLQEKQKEVGEQLKEEHKTILNTEEFSSRNINKKARIIMMNLENYKHPKSNDEEYCEGLALDYLKIAENERPSILNFLMEKNILIIQEVNSIR